MNGCADCPGSILVAKAEILFDDFLMCGSLNKNNKLLDNTVLTFCI
jgi:hypothetical protein